MKVSEIIPESRYGLVDEPGSNFSKAAQRKGVSDNQNINRRLNNKAKNDQDEFAIKQMHDIRNQVRDQSRLPTGIPNTAYQQQQQQIMGRA
jgi:hypothetical protein